MTESKELIELREKMIHLCTEAIRSGEMRQGCTNHTYYAEKIVDQILSLKGDDWSLAIVQKPIIKTLNPLRKVIWQVGDKDVIK